MVERDGMEWNGLGWVRQGKAAPVRCAFFWSVHPCPRCPAGGGGRSTNESVGTKQIFWFIAGIQTVIRYESAASSPSPDLPLFFVALAFTWRMLCLCVLWTVDRVYVDCVRISDMTCCFSCFRFSQNCC